MKKILAVLLILALSCAALASCGTSDKKGSEAEAVPADPAKAIVGTWTYETGGFTYTFNEDGTGDYCGMAFTYTVDGNKLSILYENNTAPFETEFEITGNKLNVKDSFGSDTIYVKQ